MKIISCLLMTGQFLLPVVVGRFLISVYFIIPVHVITSATQGHCFHTKPMMQLLLIDCSLTLSFLGFFNHSAKAGCTPAMRKTTAFAVHNCICDKHFHVPPEPILAPFHLKHLLVSSLYWSPKLKSFWEFLCPFSHSFCFLQCYLSLGENMNAKIKIPSYLGLQN